MISFSCPKGRISRYFFLTRQYTVETTNWSRYPKIYWRVNTFPPLPTMASGVISKDIDESTTPTFLIRTRVVYFPELKPKFVWINVAEITTFDMLTEWGGFARQFERYYIRFKFSWIIIYFSCTLGVNIVRNASFLVG